MAAGTGAGAHACVIEALRRAPAVGAVAAVASRAGLHVVCRLALNLQPVVARRATATGHAAVVHPCACKGPGVMAGLAGLGGRKVLAGLDDIALGKPRPRHMAAVAVLGGALEYAVHMAGLAAGIRVSACQGVARLKVIEVARSGLGPRRSRCQRLGQQQHQQVQAGPDPFSPSSRHGRSGLVHGDGPIGRDGAVAAG